MLEQSKNTPTWQIVVITTIFVLGIYSWLSPPVIAPAKVLDAPAVAIPQTPIYTLGMPIKSIIENINKKDTAFKINQFDLTKNKDGFLQATHQFNDMLAIIGIVNSQDQSARSITLAMAVGGDTQLEKVEAMMDIPLLISITMQAINPDVDKKIIGKISLDLVAAASDVHDKINIKKLNGNSYSLAYSSDFKSYIFQAVPGNLPQDN